jgi:hypothetical protein
VRSPGRPPIGRRRCLQAALAVAVLPAAAAAELAIRHLGIFSLLGDSVRVVAREVQELLFKDVGMDDIAFRAARAAAEERFPQAQLSLYPAPAMLSVDEQRAIGAAAARGELPDWIVQAVREASLSHVLLITSYTGAMEFRTGKSQVVGNNRVSGVGFFVSADGRTTNAKTGAVSAGYLAPFVQLRLTLVDAASRGVVNSASLSDGYVVGPPVAEAPDPWRFLTRAQKALALQRLLKSNMERGMATVLQPS